MPIKSQFPIQKCPSSPHLQFGNAYPVTISNLKMPVKSHFQFGNARQVPIFLSGNVRKGPRHRDKEIQILNI